MLLEHDEYDDWRNSSVVLEEDLLNVETIDITNRFGHEGFTRTGPDNSLVDGDAPDHGAFNEFTKEEFYNRRRCLISHYMASRERHIN